MHSGQRAGAVSQRASKRPLTALPRIEAHAEAVAACFPAQIAVRVPVPCCFAATNQQQTASAKHSGPPRAHSTAAGEVDAHRGPAKQITKQIGKLHR